MLSPSTSVVAIRETVFSDLGNEVAILSLRSGRYFGLNPVGAYVWNLIQEKHTIADICSKVANVYDVSIDRCQIDMHNLLSELLAEDLIVVEATP
ncbi:MAG: PqqD family protein [bacterium]|nr:PqqD family protein [Candidatus Kapabacteria bacterium]